MVKYTEEMKIEIIKSFNPTKISQKEYARQHCINRAQFQYWLKLYELHGEDGLKSSTYTNYTTAYKLDVLNFMVQTGMSVMDTAAIFKIPSHSTLQNWLKKVENGDKDALEPKKKGRPSMKKETNKQPKQTPVEGSPEALQARIKQLEMENEYLKKLNALVQAKEKSPKKTK